jgi:diacylglycerol O-acyltransferase
MTNLGAFPARLSSSDDMMLRLEADPVLRSSVVVVGTLDRDPRWESVLATFRRGIERVPRLRERIAAAPPWRGGGHQWSTCEDFSLEHHVRHVRAPRPGTWRDVLDLAGMEMAGTFDPARPPWTCTIIHDLEGGRAAFALRFHHTITDGVGGVALANALFDHWRSSQDREASDVVAPRSPLSGKSPVPRVTGSAGRAAAALAAPGRMARGGAHVARSTARLLAPSRSPLSPLFVDRGIDRRLHTVDIPLPDLRRSADAVGCTINDVFLAAVGGAVHDYHRRLGVPIHSLRFTMPISTRAPGDPAGGNRFVPARFTLPVDDPDPAVRCRIASGISRRWRHEPALPFASAVAVGLDRLPTPLLLRLFGSLLRTSDVDAVDVPGPEDPVYLGGTRIQRMWAFAPPVGAALSCTLFSYAGRAGIGLVSDPAAVEDPDLLETCMLEAVDGVVGLGRRRPPARSQQREGVTA